MAFILCSSGAIVVKAGANASSYAITSGAILTQFSNEAEGLINSMSRYDYTTNYGSLTANAKTLLGEIASNLAAIYVIQYDMSGFTTRIEAEDMINVLRDGALRGLSLIRDEKTKTFIGK